jgi:hypothetical protein
MNFGTPTPAFYAILTVLFFTVLASAASGKSILVFVFSLIASYLAFIASSEGFGRQSHNFAMIAGVGILVMIPTTAGCAVATGLGSLIRRFFSRNQEK